jgi:hypothetical protein
MKQLSLLLILITLSVKVKANDSSAHEPFIQKLYVSGGLGYGLMASGSVLLKRNNFYSFHYINENITVASTGDGFLSSNISKTYNCFSLTYGKSFQWKFIFLNASIGPSYVIYDEPTNVEYHNGSWFGPYYTSVNVKHKLPGAFVDGQVMFVTRLFGLGIEGYVNINQYYAPIGILGTLNFGLVNRRDND